ncbi:hypothetical protein HYZ78_00905 [Candidatus Microgenomates bacterium]|nr:hypothetical protein [Candidatus Microgenomates bacterium]
MGISNFKFQISNVQLIISVLLILPLLFFVSQIKVSKIFCRTQYGPCPESYREKLIPFVGKPLYRVNGGEIKKTFYAVEKVGEVRVLKHFMGELDVVIEVSKAGVAVQAGDDTSKIWLVTLDGTIVGQTTQSSLPKLIVRSGRVSPEDPNFVLAVRLTELFARARKVDSAEIVGQDLMVATEGIQVIMPLVGHDPQVLVGSLQLILAQGTISGKRPVKIDLRFKNAVVTY